MPADIGNINSIALLLFSLQVDSFFLGIFLYRKYCVPLIGIGTRLTQQRFRHCANTGRYAHFFEHSINLNFMKLILLLAIFLLNISYSFGQPDRRGVTDLFCQNQWQNLELHYEETGEILFYDQTYFASGRLSNASVALIKTKNNDTIRVLAICEIKKSPKEPNKFKSGDVVTVKSSHIPLSKIDYIPKDPFSCVILNTLFGTLKLVL